MKVPEIAEMADKIETKYTKELETLEAQILSEETTINKIKNGTEATLVADVLKEE